MKHLNTFAGLATIVVAAAACYAAIVTDDFSVNSVGTRWNFVDFVGQEAGVSVTGGQLAVSGQGGLENSYYTLELQDCGFAPGSWKVGISARQVAAPSAIASGDAITAFLGLQWGAFDPALPVPANINGCYFGAVMSNAGSTAATVSWVDGIPQASNFGSDSRARNFVGKMTATFTAKKDRLVLQVGRFKRTIPAFSASLPFTGSPEVVISGRTPGSISGLACTFDSFSAVGDGIVP